jgi:hypothetical protein
MFAAVLERPVRPGVADDRGLSQQPEQSFQVGIQQTAAEAARLQRRRKPGNAGRWLARLGNGRDDEQMSAGRGSAALRVHLHRNGWPHSVPGELLRTCASLICPWYLNSFLPFSPAAGSLSTTPRPTQRRETMICMEAVCNPSRRTSVG